MSVEIILHQSYDNSQSIVQHRKDTFLRAEIPVNRVQTPLIEFARSKNLPYFRVDHAVFRLDLTGTHDVEKIRQEVDTELRQIHEIMVSDDM